MRVDGRGKFLIPGLADMHTHLNFSVTFGGPERALFLLLANGVTTIRNVDYRSAGEMQPLLQLRARARQAHS